MPARRRAFGLALIVVPIFTNLVIRSYAWALLLGRQAPLARLAESKGQGSLQLISSNSEQEEAQEEMEIDYAGDPIDIGFNVTYMIDVLGNTGSDIIRFAFADANSSCLVTMPGDEDYKYVVMPMRI